MSTNVRRALFCDETWGLLLRFQVDDHIVWIVSLLLPRIHVTKLCIVLLIKVEHFMCNRLRNFLCSTKVDISKFQLKFFWKEIQIYLHLTSRVEPFCITIVNNFLPEILFSPFKFVSKTSKTFLKTLPGNNQMQLHSKKVN